MPSFVPLECKANLSIDIFCFSLLRSTQGKHGYTTRVPVKRPKYYNAQGILIEETPDDLQVPHSEDVTRYG